MRARRLEVRPAYTQTALAADVQLSKNTISRLEAADQPDGPRIKRPQREHIVRIAQAFEQYLRRPLVDEGLLAAGYAPDATIDGNLDPNDPRTKLAKRVLRLSETDAQYIEAALNSLDAVRRRDRKTSKAV
jgi:hypothetical protein